MRHDDEAQQGYLRTRGRAHRSMWLGALLVGVASAALATNCSSATDTDGGGATTTTTGTGASGATGGGGGNVGAGGQGGGPCIPEAEELCDGHDNTCDGAVDEGCACIVGETQPCYSGDPNLIGVGACIGGLQSCDVHGQFTGACNGEVLPQAETCDGKDNDCNHAIDDGLTQVTCGVGACQRTVEACLNGQPVPCVPGTPNPVETCEGSDDNCNGVVDEGCTCINNTTQACYTGPAPTRGVGDCHDGLQTCVNGAWGACGGDTLPSSEQCDGHDNNCDNATDENNPGGDVSCSTGGIGQCALGLTQCQSGQLNCIQQFQPEAEIFDCKDNDCNGQTDEGTQTACSTGLLGVCAVGTKICIQGQVVCQQNTPSSPESCDNKDNNCDGSTDEGDPGGNAACNTGLPGVCSQGTTHCQNGAIVCVQNIASSPETCDGFDNNCNGAVDDGDPGGGAACTAGAAVGECRKGTQHCVSGGIQCVAAASQPEVCDGLDNNCDGQTDNGIAQVGQACTAAGYLGVCQFGTYVCPNSPPIGLTCNHPLPGTFAETCNSLDDDCNGTVDDPVVLNGLVCSTGQSGICSPGHTNCTNGTSTCVRDNAPTTETCNSLDDDCNGAVDNGNYNVMCPLQFPGAGNVSVWGCNGNCTINTCVSGNANINGAVSDGCECPTDSYANVCLNAGSVAVAHGGSVNMTGKIETASGADYLIFNFSAPGAVGALYHPKVTLADSGGGQYAMDVLSSCVPALQGCSTSGGVNNENGFQVTTWEQNYTYIPSGPYSDNTTRISSVIVKVYRKFGNAPTCTPYTVTGTNP